MLLCLSVVSLSQRKLWPLFSSMNTLFKNSTIVEALRKREFLVTFDRLQPFLRPYLFLLWIINFPWVLESTLSIIDLNEPLESSYTHHYTINVVWVSPWNSPDYLWTSGTAELQWSGGSSWPTFPEEVTTRSLGALCHLPQRLRFLCNEPEQMVWYEVCPQISELRILQHVGRHRKFGYSLNPHMGFRDTVCSILSHLMPFCRLWTAGEKSLCFFYFGCLPR